MIESELITVAIASAFVTNEELEIPDPPKEEPENECT
jgi:hypothetical protein